MSEMIETVAKAIYEAKRLIEGVDSTWDEVKERASRPDGYAYAKLSYAASTNAARAVIEAMMEPTEAMVNAAWPLPNFDGPIMDHRKSDLKDYWQAMLSEALSPSLKEQEEGN